MSTESLDPSDVESLAATWACRLSLSTIPQAVIGVAKSCIADGIGVMLAGSRSRVFNQCATLPRPVGLCTIIDGSATADVFTAAFLNGVACHALDFDDTCYAGIVHGTAVVLPAVLAAAQEVNATGKQLLEGFIAGVEIEYALGLALTNSLYERGFWATATLGVIGAAAGTAKVLGLDRDRVAEAIRLAANMPLGLRATHGSSGKPYLCGMATKLGVEAAYAARAGIQGQPATFELRRGFAFTLNAGVLHREAIVALGNRFALLDPGIALKLRPMCSATQAAIEATIALRSQHALDAEDVRSVVCYGTSLVVTSLHYRAPVQQNEAQFSMSFAIACTLLYGDVCLSSFEDGTLSSTAMTRLMERVELLEDPNLVRPEDARVYPEATRVEITMQDGRRIQTTVMAATGMPAQPATEERLRDKFMDCASRAIGALEAAQLWDRVHRIEEVARARLMFQGLLSMRTT